MFNMTKKESTNCSTDLMLWFEMGNYSVVHTYRYKEPSLLVLLKFSYQLSAIYLASDHQLSTV
jgi:hypothetical protein